MIGPLVSAPTPAPKPDPAPIARHAALVTWDYGFEHWFRGRRYWIFVPAHYRWRATDQSGRHL
jgi:hypothetical protein